MHTTLLKALVALAPACLLLSGAVVSFAAKKTTASWLQLLGAAGLVVVILTHISEALDLFPGMRWGMQGSPGHYLDLSGAVLAMVLFPLGYLLAACAQRHSA